MAISNHIQLKWEEFKANVLLPSNPGPIQISETRKAFFAGCAAMYYLLGSATEGYNDAQMTQYVKEISGELERHVQSLKRELRESME